MTTQQERDEDLAFEQGFNSVTTDPADRPEAEKPDAKTPDPEAKATATSAVATPEAKPEPVEDPFASLPQQVRELLARVPALEARLEQTTRVANMVPALQSRIDKMNQAAPPATEQVPGKSRFAKIEAIRAELPEIADALDEIANDRHPAPESTPRQQAADTADANPQEEALTGVRPTWADDLVSSDFQLWLAQQPADYRAQVAGTDKAKDILAALGKFDSYKAQTQSTRNLNQTRSTRMAAAVTPQGDGRRQPSRVAPEDEEEAAFAAAFNRSRGR